MRTRGASDEGVETLVVVANEDIDPLAPDVLLKFESMKFDVNWSDEDDIGEVIVFGGEIRCSGRFGQWSERWLTVEQGLVDVVVEQWELEREEETSNILG